MERLICGALSRDWLRDRIARYRRIVLLPEQDEAFNDRVLMILCHKIQMRGGKKAIAGLGPEERMILAAAAGPPGKSWEDAEALVRYETIPPERMRDILSLYCLYKFSDKLLIASFDQPCGRKLRNLLDTGVATEQELIEHVILGKIG